MVVFLRKQLTGFGLDRIFIKGICWKFFGTKTNYRNSQVIGLDRNRFRQVSLYLHMQITYETNFE